MTEDSNPYAQLAERQIVGPRKSQMRAVETRARNKKTKLEAKQEEQGILFEQWQKWKEDRRKELMDGPHGAEVTALNHFLDRMTLHDAQELIERIEQGPWHDADKDTRFQVLDMVSLTIIYLREKNGLSPMDDSMPFSDEEPTVFEVIREILK